MRALTKKLATVSALAMLGMTGAQASIISGTAVGWFRSRPDVRQCQRRLDQPGPGRAGGGDQCG